MDDEVAGGACLRPRGIRRSTVADQPDPHTPRKTGSSSEAGAKAGGEGRQERDTNGPDLVRCCASVMLEMVGELLVLRQEDSSESHRMGEGDDWGG